MRQALAAFYQGGRHPETITRKAEIVAGLARSQDPLEQAVSAFLQGLLSEWQGQDLSTSAALLFHSCRLMNECPSSADQRFVLHLACVDALRLAFLLPRLDVAEEAAAVSARLYRETAGEDGHLTWRALCLLNQGLIDQYLLGHYDQAVRFYQEADALMDLAAFNPAYLCNRLEVWLQMATCAMVQGNFAKALWLQERLEAAPHLPRQPVMAALLSGRLHVLRACFHANGGDAGSAGRELGRLEQTAERLQAAAERTAAADRGLWLLESRIFRWFAAAMRGERLAAATLQREVARLARQYGCTWLRQWYFAHLPKGGLFQWLSA